MTETPGPTGPFPAEGGPAPEEPTATTDTGGAPAGHAEGEWVVDPSGRHQYRYLVHGQETDWVSDSGVESLDDHAEWVPDPLGRHQWRYVVRGQPTAAVSDGGVASTDPLGAAPGPAPTVPGPPARRGVPVWPVLVAGGVVLLLLVVAVAAVAIGRDDGSSTAATTTTALTFDPGPTTTVVPEPPTITVPTTVVPDGGGQTGTISVFELEVGDCISTPSGPTVTGVPCSEPHDFEVYALFDVPGGPSAPYPGDASITDTADTGCQGDRFTDYVGEPYATSEIYATSLSPSEATWTQQGDREVVCLARAQSGQLTGTVHDANR